jgi:hypothetical protein
MEIIIGERENDMVGGARNRVQIEIESHHS